ncbi:uncharacterized protein CTHT_0050700 [Thermochaetoides thermophila DSM 1495]|uniref:Uncharacterized protein n=1 Tax=Chaetomium thermophilum (strain DSM 1495 / CBS 144.50 / IMI 039719) TaxID=759272 RepID=G0SD38_CHATD|nr:hypothetical protein CTHT_0050700 [Thermochaetoides thermophila DSM 1495]EGS18468.1 hypothetical protein CTHT_0050700 [Thermochaetoides thermophila DSM 1495]
MPRHRWLPRSLPSPHRMSSRSASSSRLRTRRLVQPKPQLAKLEARELAVEDFACPSPPEPTSASSLSAPVPRKQECKTSTVKDPSPAPAGTSRLSTEEKGKGRSLPLAEEPPLPGT